MNRHTPVPLTVHNMEVRKDGVCIAECSSVANAHLFAAAPAMYEALINIKRAMTDPDNRVWATTKPWTKKERDEAIVNLIEQTIAQADGQK